MFFIKNKTSPDKKASSAQEHKPLLAMFVIAILFFSINALQLTQAQGGATGNTGISYPFMDTSTDVNYACTPDMKTFADLQMEDFRRFLENNFQNKSSTSSLLEPAFQKYRQLREEMLTAYGKYYPNQGSRQLTAGLQPSACLQIVNDTLNDARILLRQHALRTSNVKKTTALLEKYQGINSQLQLLSQQFTSMKALLDAFSQKLPCYIPKGACIKK